MNRLYLFFIFALTLLQAVPACAEDDFQYWIQTQLKIIDTKRVDVSLYGEGWFVNDVSENGLQFYAVKVAYNINPNLDLGTNYSYLSPNSTNSLSGDSEYTWQHRAEIEINPKWKLRDGLRFDTRNRLEFRWIEGHGSHNTRSRHRLRVTLPVSWERMAWLNGIYMDSEFFYNWAENDYDENRSVPIGLNLRINEQLTVKPFYMIRSTSSHNEWTSRHIVGTYVSYNF
ncbi:MAG: DUF2490 domain-containing protein [Candidatus Omnitrophica bacterium]|nr:DUF2490 domain-containing protein [Candidatus Omnitrophota bacterium]MCB9721938.1 DUF2490 domain-containing protein [Candidatus Omnitrophota bacterium]